MSITVTQPLSSFENLELTKPKDDSFRNIQYYPWIDVLRALCFLMVFINHFGLHFSLWYVKGFSRGGVSVFFVISGWLITNIILRTLKHENFLTVFYSRRLLRIYPAYFLTVGLYTIYALFSSLKEIYFKQLPSILTFNFGLFNKGDGLFAHAWSLAVEERFYLIWPALCLICHRLKLPLAVVFTAGLLFMTGSVFAVPQQMDASWAPLLPASIIYGCMLAIYGSKIKTFPAWVYGVVSVVSFAAFIFIGNKLGSMYNPIASLFAAALVWVCSAAPIALPKALKPLAKLGELSYSTYLIHMLVLYAISAALGHWGITVNKVIGIALFFPALIITAGLAEGITRFIEQPFLSIRSELSARPALSTILANCQFWLLPAGLTYILLAR